MNELAKLLKRSREVAARDSAMGRLQPPLPDALTHVKAIIIGCADMRVDPAHILDLKPGEAVVLRNIGGRVTPGLLAQLGMLGRIGAVAGKVPGDGGELNVIVLQHTDCGITRLADESAMLGQYFQVEERDVDSKTVLDPHAAVAGDLAILRTVPGLPQEWLLSGLVYDVATGQIETVVPPQPIGPQ
jgi:carbonic anhydrase